MAGIAPMQPPHSAPADRDVIGIDNHKFVGRYRRNIHGGWTPRGQRAPLFDDADMMGWIELPEGAK